MSVQATLNNSAIQELPKIQALIQLSEEFEANQMNYRAIASICNLPTPLCDISEQEKEVFQSDLINIFKHYDWIASSVEAMQKTRKLLQEHAKKLRPSSERAQCINIANYYLERGETIAQRLASDHRGLGQALRAAGLFEEAHAAVHVQTEHQKKKNLYGFYIFLDGSELH